MRGDDKYRIFGLSQRDKEYFSHLIPDDEYISRDGFFMLGAVDDEFEPCGVLVYEFSDGAYFVHYIYVDPDHRRCGVGTLLLQKMLWSFYQMKQVHPCFIEYTDDDENIGSFMEAQTNFMISVSGISWVISPDQRRQMNDYGKLTGMDTEAVPFFSLGEADRKKFLDSQQASGFRFLDSDLSEQASFDKELCFVIKKDDSFRAAIFSGRNESGNIELSYLYAEKMNPLSIRGVLAAFLQAIEDKYPDDTIEMTTVNGASGRLVSGLLDPAGLDQSEIKSAEWDYSLEYTK